MKQSKRLIFFGTEDFSTAALQRLILSVDDWNLLAVVTKPDAKAGRGQRLKSPAVKTMAQKANIKVFQPQRPLDILADLTNLRPTHGILSAYGKILPQQIIGIFPGGIINIHPSLLPKYRGPSPIETAILNGDKQTGISLMKLTAGVDEGPVYAQKKVEIPPDFEASLYSPYLAVIGAEFLMENLSHIIDGSLKPRPQDNSKASYTKLFKKEDGIIRWHKPAEELARQVLAFSKWPKSRARVLGHEVIVTKVQVVKDEKAGALVIKCRPGYLEILELIAPSGRKMSGADFLRGYKN